MIIIGDAAHAASPASGQGASMAIEDAVTLARCLRDLPDVQRTFGEYQRLRRDRAAKIVAHGKHNSDHFVPARIASAAERAETARKFAAEDRSWISNHRIDWHTQLAARTDELQRPANPAVLSRRTDQGNPMTSNTQNTRNTPESREPTGPAQPYPFGPYQRLEMRPRYEQLRCDETLPVTW